MRQETTILVATRNRNKVAEIAAIFKLPGIRLVAAVDYAGELPEVVEDGATFRANAIKKALTLCEASGLPTLADDSGLEVEALHGAPGVNSARYAGSEGNDRANNSKLLMALCHRKNRRARFCCQMVLVEPDGSRWHAEGFCEGVIASEERGESGFGYDPLFIPDGYEETFAELAPSVKNSISHRARALEAALLQWQDLWGRYSSA